jgi:hypothetical protein
MQSRPRRLKLGFALAKRSSALRIDIALGANGSCVSWVAVSCRAPFSVGGASYRCAEMRRIRFLPPERRNEPSSTDLVEREEFMKKLSAKNPGLHRRRPEGQRKVSFGGQGRNSSASQRKQPSRLAWLEREFLVLQGRTPSRQLRQVRLRMKKSPAPQEPGGAKGHDEESPTASSVGGRRELEQGSCCSPCDRPAVTLGSRRTGKIGRSLTRASPLAASMRMPFAQEQARSVLKGAAPPDAVPCLLSAWARARAPPLSQAQRAHLRVHVHRDRPLR